MADNPRPAVGRALDVDAAAQQGSTSARRVPVRSVRCKEMAMGRPIIRCEALGKPILNRRSVLLAVGGIAAMLPAARASARPASLADLVGADGAPSPLARSIASSWLSVRGYLAPSLDGREFTLSEQPAMPCQLCGAAHEAGAGLMVVTAQPEAGAPALQQVVVSGRLEVDGALGAMRLVDARFEMA